MTRIRTRDVLGCLTALVLLLSAASSGRAQVWMYRVYGPGGVTYVPYFPTYPGPLNPPAPIVRTSATSKPAYGAPAKDAESPPSYYSEDYTGPQGATSEESKVAYIRVRVPASAELWINNEKRNQRGAVREFMTPALDPDHIYVYNVKARWTEEGGINVEKTLRVRTISGTRVTVNFVRPPAAQPRPAASAPVVAAPRAPRVEQRPVDWTSSGAAPRSFSAAPRP